MCWPESIFCSNLTIDQGARARKEVSKHMACGRLCNPTTCQGSLFVRNTIMWIYFGQLLVRLDDSGSESEGVWPAGPFSTITSKR